MKILQINATCEHGSTGLVVKDIGNALEKAGDEVFYAYQLARNPIKNGYRVGNLLDWKVHALFSRLFGKQAYFSKSSTKKLLKWMDSLQPDIVHLHNLHSNYINLNMVLEYLAKMKIPTVITLHDCWYFTGKCFHYVDIGCDGFKYGCKNCSDKNGAPVSWLFNTAASVYKDRVKYLFEIENLKIVGCSQWITDEAKKGFLKDFDVSRIRNGVNTEIFTQQNKEQIKEKHNLTGKYVILGIAEKWMVPSNKNLISRIVKGLDDNSVFIMLGCTDVQKEYLRSFGDKMITHSFVEHRHTMAEYYCMADVFVNASHADTLPTVSMESICCGTPVITYNNSGCPELVLDGCGIVVDDYNEDEFIKAIETVKATKYDCSKIGAENFDKNKLVQNYIDLYREMI